MKQLPVVLAALILAVSPLAWADIADTPDRTPLAGKTAKGEDVLLFPNGRWEYVNTTKAAEAKKVAEQFPENKLRPEGAQGGVFGIGRYIMPGDKDYNRRSLSGK
ncbi:MAG: hypothetical protein ACOYBW_06515 [Fluviibacter phosphoraccumulans]|jgi:hypothetical protein|uniref:hypothetical protein n=1 Tax=Fluviibacter phosphoraccumulans TaxID=1751046 RepID=UPI0024E20B23|nr:hypothetical protein [Fluviibacter phosphoraccumulans]